MTSESPQGGASWDVVVVGAGFAGLYALHRLREQGFRAKVFEAGSGVGGTWYWNRYPGARCDVQSLVYCFTFDEQLYREWSWTERYATQPEILRYLDFVADRLALRHDIVFDTTITRAVFDETRDRWTLTSQNGQTAHANYVIMATGALSVRRLPGVEGLESFQGECYHTGEWPHAPVRLSGKRVGIIGTGSSAVQAIPLLAGQAAHLTVFQRTPAFVAPARNTSIAAAESEQLRRNFGFYRAQLESGEITGAGDVIIADHLPGSRQRSADVAAEERQALLQGRWEVGGLSIGRTFSQTMQDLPTNGAVADFFRSKIKEIVKDPRTADLLTPKDYPWGSRRVCVGTDYYETFNRDNVTLVDVSGARIEAFTRHGLRTADRHYELDVIVLATGFDALTGALTRIDIRGRSGRSLREIWAAEGPQCYLGISVAGIPNLFTVNGPGSPGILGNVVVGIEQHVDWIVDLLSFARQRGATCIEADREAQREWFDHVNEAAFETLFARGKNWWTKDNPQPGQRPHFVPYVRGLGPYRELCNRIAADGYRGFAFSAPNRGSEVQAP